ARDRAAAAARAADVFVGPLDIDRSAAAFSPNLEFHDHRRLGLGSLRGREALLDALRSLLEMAAAAANRIDGVFRLQSDAFLLRVTNFGTQRVGGGAYERPFLMLGILGADGRAARLEQFDIGHEAEAVARWDELVLGPVEGLAAEPPAVRPANRRVRANAATANVARLGSVVAARDVDTLPTLWADDLEIVDHTTGTVYGREGEFSSFRSLLRAQDPMFRYEPIATLGDSLALCRMWHSASGVADEKLDFGALEREVICPVEADGEGRQGWGEIFAGDRLGDAVARFYQRYAEILPDGPARTRAAATAGSVTAMTGPFDLDRYATAMAPSL